jgi:hypothetical protein
LQRRPQDPLGNDFRHTFFVIKASFICHEVDVWGSLRSLRTSLAGATARLSQQGAEVTDLRLLCADLRAEAAAARAEVQRRQSEFD